MFEYMREYSKQVTGEEGAKVYFSAVDSHVPVVDMKRELLKLEGVDI